MVCCARNLSTMMPSSLRNLSIGRPSESHPAFKTPVLFGAGLYLGLMLFGRESRQGLEYFEGLRSMFEGSGGGRGGDPDDDIGKG